MLKLKMLNWYYQNIFSSLLILNDKIKYRSLHLSCLFIMYWRKTIWLICGIECPWLFDSHDCVVRFVVEHGSKERLSQNSSKRWVNCARRSGESSWTLTSPLLPQSEGHFFYGRRDGAMAWRPTGGRHSHVYVACEHKPDTHNPNFTKLQAALGCCGLLDGWPVVG